MGLRLRKATCPDERQPQAEQHHPSKAPGAKNCAIQAAHIMNLRHQFPSPSIQVSRPHEPANTGRTQNPWAAQSTDIRTSDRPARFHEFRSVTPSALTTPPAVARIKVANPATPRRAAPSAHAPAPALSRRTPATGRHCHETAPRRLASTGRTGQRAAAARC